MTLSGPKVQTHISTEIIAKRCNSLLIKIGTTLVSSFVSNTNRFNIDDASRDNIQEVIPMGSILMCKYAALCGGRMVFNIVVRGLSRRWKSLESEYVIIFLLSWCVMSIGIPCFWQGYIPAIKKLCYGVPLRLEQMRLFSSTLGKLNYPQRLLCGILIQVGGWSCRLELLKQVLPVASTLEIHAIWGGGGPSAIPCLYRCILLYHSCRHRKIVWLLVSWILCCLLVLLYLWPIGWYLSRGGVLVCSRTGDVGGLTSLHFS